MCSASKLAVAVVESWQCLQSDAALSMMPVEKRANTMGVCVRACVRARTCVRAVCVCDVSLCVYASVCLHVHLNTIQC